MRYKYMIIILLGLWLSGCSSDCPKMPKEMLIPTYLMVDMNETKLPNKTKFKKLSSRQQVKSLINIKFKDSKVIKEGNIRFKLIREWVKKYNKLQES